LKSVRKFEWEASFDRFVHGDGRLDTRDLAGVFRVDYKNSDQIVLEVFDQAELLTKNFTIFGNVTIPTGEYHYRSVLAQYAMSTQHKLSGTVTYQQGRFYDGDKKTLALGAGRIEASGHLAFEPGVSLNWVNVSAGSFVAKVLTTRAIYTFGPRMFASALVQFNSTNHSMATNARLRWEYQPGSELFVVYSDGRNVQNKGLSAPETRSFIIKITKLFRI
jgi:hypothetical protein